MGKRMVGNSSKEAMLALKVRGSWSLRMAAALKSRARTMEIMGVRRDNLEG